MQYFSSHPSVRLPSAIDVFFSVQYFFFVEKSAPIFSCSRYFVFNIFIRIIILHFEWSEWCIYFFLSTDFLVENVNKLHVHLQVVNISLYFRLLKHQSLQIKIIIPNRIKIKLYTLYFELHFGKLGQFWAV